MTNLPDHPDTANAVVMEEFDEVMVRRDSQLCLALPETWWKLPENVQHGLIWWELIEWCAGQRRAGKMQALSPIYDVAIVVLATPEEVLAARLREDSDLTRIELHRSAYSLETGATERIAICYFAYDAPAPLEVL